MFNRKPMSGDFVRLNSGKRVLFYELTNGIVNKVMARATYRGTNLNNPLFFQLMDYELVKLSKRQLDNLPISDGNIVREKVREILTRHKILVEDKEPSPEKKPFSQSDIKWLEKTKAKQIRTFAGVRQ